MGWDIHYLISSNTTARLAVTSYGICDASLLIFLITSCLTRKPMYKPEAIAFKSLFVSILCWIVYVFSLGKERCG
jgi:hypothetical protein